MEVEFPPPYHNCAKPSKAKTKFCCVSGNPTDPNFWPNPNFWPDPKIYINIFIFHQILHYVNCMSRQDWGYLGVLYEL